MDATLSPVRRAPSRALFHLGCAGLGAAAIAALSHHIGSRALGDVLLRAADWVPVLLALEGARIFVETAATRAVYGLRARDLPWGPLLRANVVGYAVSIMMPAGRAAAEAVKAGILSRYTGVARGAAVATTNQALSLLSIAIISIPCAAAAFLAGGPPLVVGAIVLHAILTAAAGFGIQIASRHRRVGDRIGRRFPRLGREIEAFQRAARASDLVPALPLGLLLLSRGVLQVLKYGILIHAVGGVSGVGPALVGQGVNFVGTTVGDLVPAQLGTTDGAFALSARALHLSVADAVAIALLAHVVQLAWAALGALLPLLWRQRRA